MHEFPYLCWKSVISHHCFCKTILSMASLSFPPDGLSMPMFLILAASMWQPWLCPLIPTRNECWHRMSGSETIFWKRKGIDWPHLRTCKLENVTINCPNVALFYKLIQLFLLTWAINVRNSIFGLSLYFMSAVLLFLGSNVNKSC